MSAASREGLAPRAPFPPGGLRDRIGWVVLASIASAVIVTAARITPDPIAGSSRQLGLAPCGFYEFTGFHCPACGLTTAFSYMAHFDPAGAWTVNAFGILLFSLTVLFVPFAALAAARGWSLSGTLDKLYAEELSIALALIALGHWLVRVAYEWPSVGI